MTDKELKHLIESNAKTVQAILDEMAEARQERQELREGMLQIQSAVVQLTNIQERITNLLVSLDGDRPTILKKLSALETKLDQLLQQNPTDELG
jgi:two-component sensor histidine kinase